ncbi:MAG: AlkZ family DNA glycosylase [Bacteroidetes bacterium]|nr:AlkZ family DNA glycosylase [Fibrella sp.]
MTTADIITQRLINQQIARTAFQQPQEIVAWLGAMQAQEFATAKWAIGLRLPGQTDEAIEKTFNEGAILRTHLLRPTWHFVTPADIRWLLTLTAPRVDAVNAYMYRKLELDNAVFGRAYDTLIATLQGGKQRTRARLQAALAQTGVATSGFRLSYLLMRAELEGIVCSGAREGKQFTYALLDERVPAVQSPSREEALAELTRRYFASRGPATIQDFVWWSGLTIKDGRTGIAMLGADFVEKSVDGQQYVFVPAGEIADKGNFQTTFLMPEFDEYGISYKNRRAIFNPLTRPTDTATAPGENDPETGDFRNMLVVDGTFAGIWKRTLKNTSVLIETTPFAPLSVAGQDAVRRAIQRYGAFVGKAVV